MSCFEFKSKKELKKLPLEEVEKYYRDYRKYRFEQDMPIEGIENRIKIYPIVQKLLKLDKILSLRTTKLIGDQRIKTNNPKIYACTHIGRYDQESILEKSGESTWVLMGDPGDVYLDFNGIIMDMLGPIYFDTDRKFKLDRHIAKQDCIKLLQQGGNILIFPEGAWNLDPVYPVMKLFPGVIEMSIKTGADIIPVGIEQYRPRLLRNYYVNIGKNINFTGCDLKDKEELSEILRWKMADLKWEIWEKYGNAKRSSLPNDWNEARELFIDSIMRDTENGYTIEEIDRSKYQEKNKIEKPDEVFSYLNKINLSRANAFMAKDIYHYQQINNKMLKKK